jgi:hypothetical protein
MKKISEITYFQNVLAVINSKDVVEDRVANNILGLDELHDVRAVYEPAGK